MDEVKLVCPSCDEEFTKEEMEERKVELREEEQYEMDKERFSEVFSNELVKLYRRGTYLFWLLVVYMYGGLALVIWFETSGLLWLVGGLALFVYCVESSFKTIDVEESQMFEDWKEGKYPDRPYYPSQ